MDTRVLPPLNTYRFSFSRQARYIPILDKDPVLAARALTIADIKKSYILLREIFEEIRVEKDIYPTPLISTLLFSRENYLWFSAFLKELEKLLNIEEEYEISYEKCPTGNSLKAPIVYQPFHIGMNQRKEKRAFH